MNNRTHIEGDDLRRLRDELRAARNMLTRDLGSAERLMERLIETLSRDRRP